MKLTPLEIRKQEFKKAMRGYDSVEVDTFLGLVADEYDKLIQENTSLNKKVISIESELKHFKEVEKTLKQTLYKVQETSQLSRENSQKEAVLIKKEAELAASQMIERARSEVTRMKNEVESLKRQKESFAARLRHLLASQMELLDVLELDDDQVAKLKDRRKKEHSAVKKEKKIYAKNPAPVRQDVQAKNQAEPADRKKEDETRYGSDLFNDIFGNEPDKER